MRDAKMTERTKDLADLRRLVNIVKTGEPAQLVAVPGRTCVRKTLRVHAALKDCGLPVLFCYSHPRWVTA